MVRTSSLRKRRGERLSDWDEARKRIIEGPNRRSVEQSLEGIRGYFADEDELSVPSLLVALICPISKRRITEAARGAECTHFQFFDLSGFLEMQSRTPNWDCPFASCKKEISLDTIVIDEYFNGVLAQLREQASTVNKIELFPNGTWKPLETKETTTTRGGLVNNIGDDDVQEILDDGIEQHADQMPTVPLSVLYELHQMSGDLFRQFNGLGYKRLAGPTNALFEMNGHIKQQIRKATEAHTARRVPRGAAQQQEDDLDEDFGRSEDNEDSAKDEQLASDQDYRKTDDSSDHYEDEFVDPPVENCGVPGPSGIALGAPDQSPVGDDALLSELKRRFRTMDRIKRMEVKAQLMQALVDIAKEDE